MSAEREKLRMTQLARAFREALDRNRLQPHSAPELSRQGASMTEFDLSREAIARAIKEQVDGYPDLDALVAAGTLIRLAGGWYEPTSQEGIDALAKHGTAVRQSKNGRPQIKVAKPSKRLAAIAKKL